VYRGGNLQKDDCRARHRHRVRIDGGDESGRLLAGLIRFTRREKQKGHIL